MNALLDSYPVLGYFTLKAYIDLYAFNTMKLKHKSYYILISSITYYMAWANTIVVLKMDDFHNYLILSQKLYILFFIGLAVSLVRKLLSYNFRNANIFQFITKKGGTPWKQSILESTAGRGSNDSASYPFDGG